MISVEMQVKIAEWRQKAKDKTLTTEELREAVQFLRADRAQAGVVSAKAKTAKATKAAKANINSDDLLKGLEDL